MVRACVLLFAILLSFAQPCAAEQAHSHKHHALSKKTHTHSKQKSKHHRHIKPQPGLTTSSAFTQSEPTQPTALASVAIPAPQFDATYSTDITAQNLTTVTTATSEISDDDESSIDTSQQALTALAYNTVETKHYSTYQLGGTVFNATEGIYKIDCSAYIDNLLQQASPQAYSNLTDLTQTTKPTSHDYYSFIMQLSAKPVQYWRKINAVDQLQPGGILVFLNQYIHRHRGANGHVMLVMSKPIPHPIFADTYQVQVADSASSGHSDDTRLPHKSGIGIGTLLIKVNPFTGKPTAYAWRLNDHWRSHTLFAMAQPLTGFA